MAMAMVGFNADHEYGKDRKAQERGNILLNSNQTINQSIHYRPKSSWSIERHQNPISEH
jgi:hypothetical protein